MLDPTARSTWRERVQRDLKGRDPDSLAWRHDAGFRLDPLQTAGDAENLPHLQRPDLLRSAPGWSARALIAAPDPTTANALAHRAIQRGADELEFVLDALVQDGLEPEREEREDSPLGGQSLPGDGGIAVHTPEALELLLEGIDLESTRVSIAAGEGADAALGLLTRLAMSRGVSPDRLDGAVDIDPIARLTMRQLAMTEDGRVVARRTAEGPVFDTTAAAIEFCRTRCPGIRPIAIVGQTFHLAGVDAGFELGATLATAAEMARQLQPRGVDFDAMAAAATVQFQVGHEVLTEIAKLRAFRLLWAKLATAFDSAAAPPPVLAVTSGRQRSNEFDTRTNLIRSTVSTFAAAAGGADSIVVTTFDESRDDHAEDLALDQQNLLRHEGKLDRSADPLGGSFAVEALTDAIAQRAWRCLQDIERQGGLLATMRSGWLVEQMLGAEEKREAAFRTRKKTLVGINRFADTELGGPDLDADEPDHEHLLTAFETWHDGRDDRTALRVQESLAGATALERLELLTTAPDLATVTMGELTRTAWPQVGLDYEHQFAPVAATDGHEFEMIRARTAFDDEPDAPLVLLLPIGPVKMARARADFARDLFAVGGLRVEDPGILPSVDAALDRIARREPEVVVLCSDDDSYPELAPSLASRLPQGGPKLVIAGSFDAGPGIYGCVHRKIDAAEWLDELLDELAD